MPFICLFSYLVSFSTISRRHGELDCLQEELMNLLCLWEFINNIRDIFKSILLCSPIMALIVVRHHPRGKTKGKEGSTYLPLASEKQINKGSVSKLCFLLFVTLNAKCKCMFKCFGCYSKMWIILPEGKSAFLQPLSIANLFVFFNLRAFLNFKVHIIYTANILTINSIEISQ